MNHLIFARILNKIPLPCLIILWDKIMNKSSFESIGKKIGWSGEWARRHFIYAIKKLKGGACEK